MAREALGEVSSGSYVPEWYGWNHSLWLRCFSTPSALQVTKKAASLLTPVAVAEAVLAEAAGQGAEAVGAAAVLARTTKAPILLLPRDRTPTVTAQAAEVAQDVAAEAGAVEILTAMMAQVERAPPIIVNRTVFVFNAPVRAIVPTVWFL